MPSAMLVKNVILLEEWTIVVSESVLEFFLTFTFVVRCKIQSGKRWLTLSPKKAYAKPTHLDRQIIFAFLQLLIGVFLEERWLGYGWNSTL